MTPEHEKALRGVLKQAALTDREANAIKEAMNDSKAFQDALRQALAEVKRLEKELAMEQAAVIFLRERIEELEGDLRERIEEEESLLYEQRRFRIRP